ncbi:CLUMA_CG007846, isoform A [Clunio marinus]|uniref:CLUMA_CG007846, isoform A n=1 Tax=Clunio marinus TaxID=568069 RepID=A0A1J1I291_9DIPT|nr:CLUMA_CG007846, isoform A [Clunio marinus]
MFNISYLVMFLLVGLIDVNTMTIKRSEKSANNLEKVDETEDPLKVNYDVYPFVACGFLRRFHKLLCPTFIA